MSDRHTTTMELAHVSIGVDLVRVERVRRIMAQPAGREKLLTPRELAHCAGRSRQAEHQAARFAAKEAVLKAFGTGRTGELRWTEIEIVNGESGRPRAVLHGAAAALADRRGLVSLEVSLSHTAEYALADAIAIWAAPTKDHVPENPLPGGQR